MRIYEVLTNGSYHIVEANELDYEAFQIDEPLVFFRENQVHAVFRNWDIVIDITEKEVG